MKHTRLLFATLILSLSTAVSLFADAAAPVEETMRKNSIKIRGAAFYPQGSLTRKIYGNFWPEGSIEYDYQFFRHWAVFANGAVTHKSGHSVGVGHKTRITLVPTTVGINAKIGGSSWFHPYLGIGVGAAYVHFFNDSDFIPKHTHKWGFASFYQAGMEFDVNKWFFVDVLAAYRFNWFGFNNMSHRQTGGLDLGAGLGFRF
ncbi:MAG: porin family protein [Chlamydiales bacterium]|nr:porin family protein [Chlamydiales bacterium]